MNWAESILNGCPRRCRIVRGVQVVKLQAWEGIFAERVHIARTEELRQRRKLALLKGANIALAESTNVSSIRQIIDPSVTFSSRSLSCLLPPAALPPRL